MTEKRPESLTPPRQEVAETDTSLQIGLEQNTLLIGGRILESSDGPELLQEALTNGRETIIYNLDQYRRHIQDSLRGRGSEVALAPFSVMTLADEPKDVLSADGLARHRHFEEIFPTTKDIQEQFHPFWKAVEASGFIPEVRIYGSESTSWDPIHLWANVPETQDEG